MLHPNTHCIHVTQRDLGEMIMTMYRYTLQYDCNFQHEEEINWHLDGHYLLSKQ